MAEAILAAQKEVINRKYELEERLWNLQSAFECVEAKAESLSGGNWSVVGSALGFANQIFKDSVALLAEDDAPDPDKHASVPRRLWSIFAIYECVQSHVESKLIGDTSSVSNALALLNPDLYRQIGELADLLTDGGCE